MGYYLVTMIKNTQGQFAETITRFANLDSCKVRYHQQLASFHNASDVATAVVEILMDSGRLLPNYIEIVNHEEPLPTE